MINVGAIWPEGAEIPIGWVAAAGVVGSVVTGSMQADAASNAANQQAQSAQNAQNISQNEFNTITAQNAPYMNSGYGALSALDYGLGISPQTATGGNPNAQPTPSQGQPAFNPTGGVSGTYSPYYNGQGAVGSLGSFQFPPSGNPTSGLVGNTINRPGAAIAGGTPPAGTQPQGQTGGLGFGSLTTPFTTQNWQQLSPAYNFQKQQGMQGVQNANAAGAGALSGSALKDLTDYNQSAANTSFNNAFNQYQTQQGNIFSRLSGIAGLGQSSANNTGQQGTTLAGQAAQSATNIGTAQAGGIVGGANAISGAISGAVPWLAAGGGGNNAAAWDTENPNNFQDFTPVG